jgi:hypothetical protein
MVTSPTLNKPYVVQLSEDELVKELARLQRPETQMEVTKDKKKWIENLTETVTVYEQLVKLLSEKKARAPLSVQRTIQEEINMYENSITVNQSLRKKVMKQFLLKKLRHGHLFLNR